MSQVERQETVELRHDGSSPALASFEAGCVLTAYSLIGYHVWRFSLSPALLTWHTIWFVIAAWPTADLVSGLVHWAADTWGREDFPVLGKRFLRPFRVHHVTPRSFLECGFWDTNGDTALIALPFLLITFLIPLDDFFSAGMAVFLVSFTAFALPTNQIHQWAHMSQPPRIVRWLQRCGLILSCEEHQRHHQLPHTTHYCITTGRCNSLLEALRFFRILEGIVSCVTGARPRSDEDGHREVFQSVISNPDQSLAASRTCPRTEEWVQP